MQDNNKHSTSEDLIIVIIWIHLEPKLSDYNKPAEVLRLVFFKYKTYLNQFCCVTW